MSIKQALIQVSPEIENIITLERAGTWATGECSIDGVQYWWEYDRGEIIEIEPVGTDTADFPIFTGWGREFRS